MKSDHANSQKAVEYGKTILGAEFGSTRIKTVLISENHTMIASGSHEWENQYKNGNWTYSLEEVWKGLQNSFRILSNEVLKNNHIPMETIGGIGISAMMHGYLPFDKHGNLLVPFRTWRNTTTSRASEELTDLFQFNIPQRWSIAHLYQAMLNEEPHVKDIAYLTTLAGYVHWRLTGKKVLGIGDASGMFPIDTRNSCFHKQMIDQFNQLIDKRKYPWKLQDILPGVLLAGEEAGELSEEGARLLDPSRNIQAGIPLCPPEGDAGTGMVATNSVAERTCNVSAGTSIFAMVVLEKSLSRVHPEIDMVMTPTGKPVAMVHANNCTSDLNAWVQMFQELVETFHGEINQSILYDRLFHQALAGDPDCGGLLTYNFISGEHILQLAKGAPLFVRSPESKFTLANFMRVHLFSALGALRIGMDILLEDEKVRIDQILGHGGFFKTREVGQRILAAAMNVPVSVMETAGEGGAWGIALLADYRVNKRNQQSLELFLSENAFVDTARITVDPNPVDVSGFNTFMKRYHQGLEIEQAAVQVMG